MRPVRHVLPTHGGCSGMDGRGHRDPGGPPHARGGCPDALLEATAICWSAGPPHARGDAPVIALSSRPTTASSPRTWGGAPASAAPKVPTEPSPHARGGAPYRA